MADGSSLSIHDNIVFTNEIVEYAHSHNVLVEAEVGQVKGIEDDIFSINESIATKEDIEYFLDQTDVDFIAVAFGNAHGDYKSIPNLNYDLVKYTTSITDKPFVVHGGSGLSDGVLKRLIAIKGVNKINISTELKSAYKEAIIKVCESDLPPQKATQLIHDDIVKVVLSKIMLLPGGNN